jgi:hypothetical protein
LTAISIPILLPLLGVIDNGICASIIYPAPVVLAESTAPASNPKTGDSSLFVYFGILLLAGTAALVMVRKKAQASK